MERLRLVGQAARQQAEAIRFAAEVGIPKQLIHELTGRSRSAINQTLAREAERPRPLCDYCIQEQFQAMRSGQEISPLNDACGYLIYRVGDRPEVVAQRLCVRHLKEDWETRLPSSARRVATAHMPNQPGKIVYSLGGLRDDRDMFRSYFGSGEFAEWEQIQALLNTLPG